MSTMHRNATPALSAVPARSAKPWAQPERMRGGLFQGEWMRATLASIDELAASDVPVVLQGETGAGKEVLAREIHARSRRGSRPFVKINCAAVPFELLESELFGYERGAFTGALAGKPGKFELADGGTILLDEVGDMDAKLQAKLLHVLQDGEFQRLGGTETIRVDVRVLAATHRNLREEIRTGRFREDLYYRLNVVTLRVPPLRERRDEILPLARYFLARHAGPNRAIPILGGVLEQALLSHSWPGNVRELENLMRRFLVFPDSMRIVDELREASAGAPLPGEPPVAAASSTANCVSPAVQTLNQVAGERARAEAEAILAALDRVRWNRRRAAVLLNVEYKSLLYRMKKLGIGAPRGAAGAGRG